MFDIDKDAFGAFILELRKEKGFTQKELAERLMVSDKAVSKWERALSLPDVTLLIPLSETLGVTVTELLECKRKQDGDLMDAEKAETLVKKALVLSEETAEKFRTSRRKAFRNFMICLGMTGAELLAVYGLGYLGWLLKRPTFWTFEILSITFGICAVLFVKEQLPAYYDEYQVSCYSAGIFRMNLSGVYFNNRNWYYIVRALRIWTLVSMVSMPVIYLVAGWIFSGISMNIFEQGLLFCYLGSLLIPLYVVGKKYE